MQILEIAKSELANLQEDERKRAEMAPKNRGWKGERTLGQMAAERLEN